MEVSAVLFRTFIRTRLSYYEGSVTILPPTAGGDVGRPHRVEMPASVAVDYGNSQWLPCCVACTPSAGNTRDWFAPSEPRAIYDDCFFFFRVPAYETANSDFRSIQVFSSPDCCRDRSCARHGMVERRRGTVVAAISWSRRSRAFHGDGLTDALERIGKRHVENSAARRRLVVSRARPRRHLADRGLDRRSIAARRLRRSDFRQAPTRR